MNSPLLDWYTNDTMKHIFLPCAAALTLLLAGCGGGGGSTASTLPAVVPTSVPSTSPTTNPNGIPTASITVTAPTRIAAANSTLAPVTQIIAVIKSINGNTTIPGALTATTVVPVTSTNCSGPICTFALPAPAGTISTVITEYAGSTYVATGSFTFTSTGNSGQTEAFTLGAIVGAQGVEIGAPSLTIGTASSQPINFLILDASGAELADSTPFANSITITDNDSSGSTKLEVGSDASTEGTTALLTNADEIINLVYNGSNFQSTFDLTATGTPAEVATTSGYKEAPFKGK